MVEGVCPLCAGTDVYAKSGGVVNPQGGGLVVSRGLFKKGILLDALICGRCGYVAFHVPPHEMENLHVVFKQWGWSRLRRLKG